MDINQRISGFLVTGCRETGELGGNLYIMEHEKSGARLVWLDRPEENKTFSIAFRTQPWDDTGVFHILEHSVLCGSDRYPVKEPFVELMKSSLNTFLNAFTFPDKTMYPVSSRNDQDFINLVRVYMDAVLHPRIHSMPEIFRQEGWHYEIDETGAASYKGVVFNEMKGAFASPDEITLRELNRLLFPDNCYRFVSGGDPEHIPELTYESFAAAHKRLYHPANSYIFLDGALDIAATLAVLNDEFLAAYDKIPAPAPIAHQTPVHGSAEACFELSPQEDTAGRARLAQGFVACTFDDRKTQTALEVLCDVLCGDNHAPLTRRLLESGLAQEAVATLQGEQLQPWVLLEARSIREEDAGAVAGAMRDELARLAREGLDHDRILATLDNMEFHARLHEFEGMPQGICLAIQVMDSWLYGGDPAASLSVGALFDGLRKKCAEGYFEALIRSVFLGNPHSAQLLARPSHTAGEALRASEAERLANAQAAWTPEDVAAIRTQQEAIRAWQAAPDSPESLASIPMLRLNQIPAEPDRLPIDEMTCAGLPVLRHTIATGSLTHISLYFAADDMDADDLSRLAFLAQLLGSVETQAHALDSLQREIRTLFGELDFSVSAYGEKGRPDRCRTFLCVDASVMDSKLDRALAFLPEILLRTRFDNRAQVLALLRQCRAALAEQLVMDGHTTAMTRVNACESVEGAVREQTGGVTCLRWLTDLERNFDERFPPLAGSLARLAAAVFTRARLTVSVTASSDNAAEHAASRLAQALPEGAFTLPETPAIRPWGKRREGIVIPADISFAALGGAFPAAGRGEARVMGQCISLAYLWNAVRVQGGAYGVGLRISDTGLASFYSYRDPSAARTLGCYRRSAAFLDALRDMDLTGLIIGTVAETDPLLTPRTRGKTADIRHWRRVAHEDLCNMRREILSASAEDILALQAPLAGLTESGSICVLGTKAHLDACGDLLSTVSVL